MTLNSRKPAAWPARLSLPVSVSDAGSMTSMISFHWHIYQVTYRVRRYLFRRHSRTSEAGGLGEPVLDVAHPRFLTTICHYFSLSFRT